MDSGYRRKQQLATRILRLREAVQRVEEGRLVVQQQYVQRLEASRQQARSEHEELQQALVKPGVVEQWSLYHHQLLALRERYDLRRQQYAEGDRDLEQQKTRVKGAYVEAERWRSFSRGLSQTVFVAEQDDERKQVEEVALSRHWRKGEDVES